MKFLLIILFVNIVFSTVGKDEGEKESFGLWVLFDLLARDRVEISAKSPVIILLVNILL